MNSKLETRNSKLRSRNPKLRIRQAGFSLVTAIFLVVVLAALGGFILTFFGLQQSSAIQDVQGARAYQAARTGIELAAYQSIRSNSCPASTDFALTGNLTGYTATVTCTRSTHTEIGAAADTVTLDQIASTACNQPSAGACPNATPAENYVSRTLTATLAK